MNHYIVGCRRDLTPELFHSLMAYRYDVFVQKLGWSLPAYAPGLEQDEFDTDETVYLVCRRDDGGIVGCGRLLPTTAPYLLQRLFPELVEVGDMPRSALTWELSRFAATPLTYGGATSSSLSADVFCANLLAAAELGATEVVGVLSMALERMCRGFGISLERLGSPRTCAGQRIVACAVDVSGLKHHGRAVPVRSLDGALQYTVGAELPASALRWRGVTSPASVLAAHSLSTLSGLSSQLRTNL